ncbi:hypothetical protein FGG08_003399 [Glutinoglossum americanum]|uniref:Pyridoxal phosphate homeostasis protein n=1 Tax=Glutinoglossum americanum TaxID=1670608 RepID=A0A9P8I794_9PEZI|nr:hypothetical protein FGG08_003399 [Glutinoglossum americanum]
MADGSQQDGMKINTARAKELVENISSVALQVIAAAGERPIRLVAVSKLKPASDILALHNSSTASPPGFGQLHFGENYQQELLEKSRLLPNTIRWHFIGQLQTNKCRPLAEQIPNLWCVESVDTTKKADQLEKGRAKISASAAEVKLRVFVQVNTSHEESKSGCEPSEAADLSKHILEKCPHLHLQGLMTIGAIARSRATSQDNPNEDFITLRQARDRVAETLGVDKEALELSMGMSGDFEGAIREGSTEVRVGSTIFGERLSKKDAKIKDDVQEAPE